MRMTLTINIKTAAPAAIIQAMKFKLNLSLINYPLLHIQEQYSK